MRTHILTVWTKEDKWGSRRLNAWLLLCCIPTKQLVTYPWIHGFSRNLEPTIFLVPHPPLVNNPPLCISWVVPSFSNLTLYPFLDFSYFLSHTFLTKSSLFSSTVLNWTIQIYFLFCSGMWNCKWDITVYAQCIIRNGISIIFSSKYNLILSISSNYKRGYKSSFNSLIILKTYYCCLH